RAALGAPELTIALESLHRVAHAVAIAAGNSELLQLAQRIVHRRPQRHLRGLRVDRNRRTIAIRARPARGQIDRNTARVAVSREFGKIFRGRNVDAHAHTITTDPEKSPSRNSTHHRGARSERAGWEDTRKAEGFLPHGDYHWSPESLRPRVNPRTALTRRRGDAAPGATGAGLDNDARSAPWHGEPHTQHWPARPVCCSRSGSR